MTAAGPGFTVEVVPRTGIAVYTVPGVGVFTLTPGVLALRVTAHLVLVSFGRPVSNWTTTWEPYPLAPVINRVPLLGAVTVDCSDPLPETNRAFRPQRAGSDAGAVAPPATCAAAWSIVRAVLADYRSRPDLAGLQLAYARYIAHLFLGQAASQLLDARRAAAAATTQLGAAQTLHDELTRLAAEYRSGAP